jgi:NAD(P)-dependent dehydrogenase (short-subunit alcohol dehydrogenase family)
MLTQCIAVDHGAAGVRANCICPGWVRTPMADAEMDELAGQLEVDREGAYAAAVREVPLQRASEPEEIAELAAWLLSDAASYVNGAVVPVDGGHVAVDAGTTVFR